MTRFRVGDKVYVYGCPNKKGFVQHITPGDSYNLAVRFFHDDTISMYCDFELVRVEESIGENKDRNQNTDPIAEHKRLSEWLYVEEQDYKADFYLKLSQPSKRYDFVTGPGRSGAIASVYASHFLSIPFVPHKAGNYGSFKTCLVVDTVEYTGQTLRKSVNWHRARGLEVDSMFTYKEYKGHYYKFWYEVY